MARTIEIVLQDGETLEPAVRRFKQLVKEVDLPGEVKKHSSYPKRV